MCLKVDLISDLQLMKLNAVIVVLLKFQTSFRVFFLQIRGWKAWEVETSTHDYVFANGMSSNNLFLHVFLLLAQNY